MAETPGTYAQIPCAGGIAMDAYSTHPRGPSVGSLIVIQEIFGVTPAMREIADDFSAHGFACVVPDIFFRLERRVELGNGEDDAKRNHAIDLMKRFDLEQGVRDLVAAAGWARAQRAASEKVGVLGFCLGGRLSALVGATGVVDSACSFYGVGLDRYLDRLALISIPVQLHFGEADNQISPSTIEAVRETLSRSPTKWWEVHTYPGAQHAFYNRHRLDRFDAAAHESARRRLLYFLRESLAPRPVGQMSSG